MSSATQYPIRQALQCAIQYLITTYALPAIAAAFAADPLSANWPVMQAQDVVIGDLFGVKSATLCIYVTQENEQPWLTEAEYMYHATTQIQLKLPSAGANRPQEQEMFGSIVVDTIRDLLTSAATWNITPVNPNDNSQPLPDGSVFTSCYLKSIYRTRESVTSGEGVLKMPSWIMLHHAETSYQAGRPNPVGG